MTDISSNISKRCIEEMKIHQNSLVFLDAILDGGTCIRPKNKSCLFPVTLPFTSFYLK